MPRRPLRGMAGATGLRGNEAILTNSLGHLTHDGREVLEGVGVTRFLNSHAELREALGVEVPA